MATIKNFTDIPQSQTLAKFLPLESADMWYEDAGLMIPCLGHIPKEHTNAEVPCWSLAALLDVLPDGTDIVKDKSDTENEKYMCTVGIKDDIISTFANNPIDACVEMIEKLYKPITQESEDERMRKHIIKVLKDNFSGEDTDKCIAWLEKQGEQKPADKGENEPKFEIEKDKWYVCIKDLLDNYANKAFRKGDIYLSTQNGSLIPSNSNAPYKVVCPNTYFRDWTIQDAKDGDVLATSGCLLIFEKLLPKDGGGSYCHYDFVSPTPQFDFTKDYNWYFGKEAEVYPATKEQRDLLFQKMKEAGYEWNADKKELKKIEQKPTEWNRKDRLMLNACINILNRVGHDTLSNWLEKSIKKLQSKSKWNEEDDYYYRIIQHIIIDNKCVGKTDKENAINWFKSFKPQKQIIYSFGLKNKTIG